jgi:hypothetical protein
MDEVPTLRQLLLEYLRTHKNATCRMAAKAVRRKEWAVAMMLQSMHQRGQVVRVARPVTATVRESAFVYQLPPSNDQDSK